MKTDNNTLEKILKNNTEKMGRILSLDLNNKKLFIFDFTENNKELQKINLYSAKEFDKYVKKILQLNNAIIGIGKYNENRTIYKHNELFGTTRTIHLGVDIILPAGTKILSPLNAIVHSFQNNTKIGDYGPTIILQHKLEGIKFYTLYGHLSKQSLNKKEGQLIEKGKKIGEIGDTKVNGNWFEHLHFQIIKNMHDMKGDFPGVTNIQKRNKWLKICPDPNLLLKLL